MNEKSQLSLFLQAHIPFAATFVRGEVTPRPVLTRIIEGAMVAAIGGAVSAYITMSNIQAVTTSQLQDLKAELAQQHSDTVRQIEDLHFEVDSLARGGQPQIYPYPPPDPPGNHRG